MFFIINCSTQHWNAYDRTQPEANSQQLWCLSSHWEHRSEKVNLNWFSQIWAGSRATRGSDCVEPKLGFELTILVGHTHGTGVHDGHRAEVKWLDIIGSTTLLRSNLFGPETLWTFLKRPLPPLLVRASALNFQLCCGVPISEPESVCSQGEECFAPPLSRLLSRARVL